MSDNTQQFPPTPPTGQPFTDTPPPPVGKKKMSKGKKWAIGIGAFVALGIIGNLGGNSTTPTAAPVAPAAASSTPSPTSSTQSAEEKAKAEAEAKAKAEAEAKAQAEAKAKAEAEAKAAAAAAAAEKARLAALKNPKSYAAISDRSFALVAKSPDKYVGKKYVVYGYVSQFDSATGPDTFRASLAGKKKSYWFDYDTNAIVRVDDTALVENVVEDDLVTLYVEVVGSLSYDTQIGGNTTVPEFKAHIIKVTGSTN